MKQMNGLSFTLIAKKLLLYQEKQTLSKSSPYLKHSNNLKVSWDQYIILKDILCPLLKNSDKHKTLSWSAEHEYVFQKLVAKITQKKTF